jgi:membrane protein implicated in regulation of membrane protease activity
MSIGTGVVLFVIGAILTFAVNVDTGTWVNLDLIGYILMGAGLVVFVIGLVMLGRRRQAVTTSRTGADPVTGERVSQRVTEVDDPASRVA